MFCFKFLSLNFLGILALTTGQQQQQELDYFLRKSGISQKPFNLSKDGSPHVYTNFDIFRDGFSAIRVFHTQLYSQNEKVNIQRNRQRGKLQPKIPKSQKFPCSINGTRSAKVPHSVHHLRPGDIDIIAAMGDSLTAGSGMLAENILQDGAEFRGITSSGGGLKDWRTYLTLPNILKVFNQNLYGYAIGNTLARERAARFNVAEPNAVTGDMPFQAHVLIKRLTSDPKVDMAKHWKLITLFIGTNDVCSYMCYYDKLGDFFKNHRKELYRTLDILKTQVPRLLVNIVPVPNLPDILLRMRNLPLICQAEHRISCSCIVSDKFSSAHAENYSEAIKRVQEIDREVAYLPEFQTNDFAVVYQPFTTDSFLPPLKNGDTDLRYFCVDCFHYSQLANALSANMLWNNMMQREGRKHIISRQPFGKFECPSEERPFIATLRNSLN